MRNNRILLVHNFYDRKGGEEIVLFREKLMLERSGFEVELFSVENDNESNFLQNLLSSFDFVTSLRSGFALRKKIRQYKPSIVHFHNVFPKIGVMIYRIPRSLGVASVATIHNFRYVCSNGLFLRDGKVCTDCLDKRSSVPAIKNKCYRDSRVASFIVALGLSRLRRKANLSYVDRIIVMNYFNQELLVRYGVEPKNIFVKPHSVENSSISSSCEKEFDFCFVGRLAPEKGFIEFLEALLNSEYPKASVVVVGDGPEREKLEAISESLKLNVSFLGRLPESETLECISKSKFLIFPSVWYETFGLVVIEAFSLSVPVIAGGLGDVPNMLQRGLGFIYNSKSDFSDKINTAMKLHHSEYCSMSERCYLEYSSKYSPEINRTKLLECYEDAYENRLGDS